MTVIGDLTDDERTVLFAALRAAPVVISAASPGRKEETASEGYAAASAILQSRDAYVANPLVSSIIVAIEQRIHAEQPFPDHVAVATAPDAEAHALAALRAGAALLDARCTPDEAAGTKRWLLEIARVTAEAGKEDQGFLGRGGVLVNDEERAALARVAEALGVPV
jgi:hypothetical protein